LIEQWLKNKDTAMFLKVACNLIAEPGQVWNYNSGGSQLLSEIVQKVTGKTARDYAAEKIFGPLGIFNIKWRQDQQGHSTAGWGLRLTTFDIAKIGYLFLREGRWKEKQVIPVKWVKESTRKYMEVKSGFGRGFGYGYQWWVYNRLPYNAYKAWGIYGKHAVMIIVIPNLDLLIVLAGNNKNDRRLLKSYIIPAIKSSNPITPNPETVGELQKFF
jgi:CubicO group peptidase (beta-lactamase class C family)